MKMLTNPLWGFLLALVLTTFATQALAQSNDTMDVAILNLESSQVDVAALASLTAALRDEAAQVERYKITQTPSISISELTLMLGCEYRESACLQQVADHFETRIVIFGTSSYEADIHHVTVDIFDAKSARIIHAFKREFDSNQNLTIAFRREIAAFFANPKSIPTTRLEITSNVSGADIRLDDVLVGTTPFERLGLPAGSYRLKLSAPGFQDWETTITLTESGESKIKVPLAALNGSSAHLADASTRPGQLHAPRAINWGAWSAIGVGAVALGTSGALAFMMNSTEQEIADRISQGDLTQREHQQLIDRGKSYQLPHMVLLGVGAVGLTSGIIWLLVDGLSNNADHLETADNSLQINLTPSTVSATWRW